ncbi:MAG: tRNA (adenosine(37)-N6)-threonylcarbamoyltransferase complex dimerization subunit type 1 TsaB [Christensenellales bacterium]|jgi:tRNA threonylcarbamoyladenosine biosynthesis protein TsaB
MKILAIDTSGNVCSVAVLKNDRVICEIYVDNKKTHSEMLGPMIDDCLMAAQIEIIDIDLFCCAIGPGSFTGLRIGASMIKAFSHASKKPALGVNTLDALAYNASGGDQTVCPVIDARRGDVYTATYRDGERISGYRAMPLDTVLSELKDIKTVFLGDAAVNYRSKILSASDSFRIAHSGIVLQRASSVGLTGYELFNKGLWQDVYELEPFYLRETQAERIYNSRCQIGH